jgi:hypothetical protein
MSHTNRILLALAGVVAAGSGALAALTLRERRHLESIRNELALTTGPEVVFSEAMVADMPAPAKRFFLHTIQPGTSLARVATIEMSGEIKVNDQMGWSPFTAHQVLAAGRGFLWEARVRMRGMLVTGSDYYLNNQGRMRIAPLGLIPVVNASNPDIARAARARVVAELLWWLPSSFFLTEGARVEPYDDDRFVIVYPLDGEESRMLLTVDSEGRLIEGVLLRWGNQTESGDFDYIPFGGKVEGEQTFDGYNIASRASVGWWFGTERYREFFRVTLDNVLFST